MWRRRVEPAITAGYELEKSRHLGIHIRKSTYLQWTVRPQLEYETSKSLWHSRRRVVRAATEDYATNRRYQIRSVLGKVLDADLKEGQTAVKVHADIQLWDWHRGPNQIWSIEETSDGTYVIRSDSSPFVLDVERGEDRIQLYDRLGTPNQKWRIEPVNADTAEPLYKIISVQSNKALDAVNAVNGDVLQLSSRAEGRGS
jgi:hypothetical protein